MTKSGIGTASSASTLPNTTNNNNSNHHQNTLNQNSSSSSALISKTEIPIWVSDRKKWVTGINKRTTINDLIFAVLKQCQVINPPQINSNKTQLKSQSKSNLNNDEQQKTIGLMEQIASQYVLCEYDLNASTEQQKVLDGDSKVYKYFNRWLNAINSNNCNQTPPQITLKILQKVVLEQTNLLNASENETHSHHTASLASKLLKKFGVNTSQSGSNANQNHLNINDATKKLNNSFRLIDVKLPQNQNNTNNSNKTQTNNHSPANSSSSSNSTNSSKSNSQPQLQQKNVLFNSILERESKIKQQKERFALLDEILKETERKNNQLNQKTPTNYHSLSSAQLNVNDILTFFPELSSTHSLNEVEEFSRVCSQLFQLEETIQSQKDLLVNLENELQKELNNNQAQYNLNTNLNVPGSPINNSSDLAETMELRKEVSLSREQTRIQCKQLHDLDAKMRLNEQSLLLKEQQLQQLLEELYVQEINTEYAFETKENSSHLRHVIQKDFENLNLNESQEFNDLNNHLHPYYNSNSFQLHQHQSQFNLLNNNNYNDENADRIVLGLSGGYDELDHDNSSEFASTNINLNLSSKSTQNLTNGSIRFSNAHSLTQNQSQQQGANHLNPSQKSQSIGNLLSNNSNEITNQNTAFQQQQQQPQHSINNAQHANISPTFNTTTNTRPISSLSNHGTLKLKASPSLDLKTAQHFFNANTKPTKGYNLNHTISVGQGNLITEHSMGDNDSGISSVSSEAALQLQLQQQQQQQQSFNNPSFRNQSQIQYQRPLTDNNANGYAKNNQMNSKASQLPPPPPPLPTYNNQNAPNVLYPTHHNLNFSHQMMNVNSQQQQLQNNHHFCNQYNQSSNVTSYHKTASNNNDSTNCKSNKPVLETLV